ncbi:MAG: IS110 family transposase [Bacteroidetes bacterium]|nr:IS110 family transposase [Bacteroidota bacterium]MDA1120794.1 IS110 family transposase [Bacteroidota bacterium]
MKYKVFIGVDVSKETLDFVVIIEGEKLFHLQVSNDTKGINLFYKRLLKEVGTDHSHWLLCLEHTGIYCNPLLEFVGDKDIPVWLENAVKIKVFHALERGKNDALDALRIAEYAYAKRDKVRLWEAPREVINQLKSMIRLRKRLLTSKKRLLDPLKEEKQHGNKQWAKEHDKLLRPVIVKIEKQLKEVERKIQQLIDGDDYLKQLYQLITSVSGVGQIVAINTLVVTNEFKQITDPKKMACHCGVAPFKYDSGKTIRSRAKVSHRADKSMKVLLHLAAMSAITSKGELRDYYVRKVDEGKNKMAIINAIRNKIIHRIFACVRENRKYEKIYTHALA